MGGADGGDFEEDGLAVGEEFGVFHFVVLSVLFARTVPVGPADVCGADGIAGGVFGQFLVELVGETDGTWDGAQQWQSGIKSGCSPSPPPSPPPERSQFTGPDAAEHFRSELVCWFQKHCDVELQGSWHEQYRLIDRLKDNLLGLRRNRANASGTPRKTMSAE